MMNHDVFISYSTKNKSTADAICHTLESHKIKCWIAPRDLLAGEKYGSIIEQAIDHCKVCVFIFSKDSRDSVWCESELNNAFSGRKTIIPFKIDNSELDGELKLMLNNRHWIDAFPHPENNFAQLVISVQMALGTAVTATQPVAKSKGGNGNKVGFIVGGVAVVMAAIAFLYFSVHQGGDSDIVETHSDIVEIHSDIVETHSEPSVEVVVEDAEPTSTSTPESLEQVAVEDKPTVESTPSAEPVVLPTPKPLVSNPEAEKLFAEGQVLDKSGDVIRAVEIYKRAAKLNSADACKRLAQIYAYGAGNISANRMQAEMWSKKASELESK